MFNYEELEKTITENGAIAYNTTKSKVYDLFALGGAYRSRTDEDVIELFSKAYKEDKNLALKCLWYLRDRISGQGERRFFKVCLNWLASGGAPIENLLAEVAAFGRWDDLFILFDTPLEEDMLTIIREQLLKDNLAQIKGEKVSLLAKWLKSENTSSKESIAIAKRIRKHLEMSAKDYRQMLSRLRKYINVLEMRMSTNQWDSIEFDKLPSIAGYRYSKCFGQRDETYERYEEFINSKETKVNAGVLYPYQIVEKINSSRWIGSDETQEDIVAQKYWENLPDYFEGKKASMLCVVDVSGSMSGTPMDVATSLGIYCSERQEGELKDKVLSFSKDPKFIDLSQYKTIAEKYRGIQSNDNVGFSTDLIKTFKYLKRAIENSAAMSAPETLVVISDMEIDSGSVENSSEADMTRVRREWEEAGLKMPHLVYWNVDARQDTILEREDGTTLVSGCNATIFSSVITGKTGYELMIEKLMSERYDNIKIN